MLAVPSVSQVPPQPMRILVVEDEVLVRLLVTEELRDFGFVVIEANSADAARSFLEAGNGVDLIFSDVRLPGAMDGLALARFVERHYPNLPIILTSANMGAEATGAAHVFVAKPYRMADVAKLISATLGVPAQRTAE